MRGRNLHNLIIYWIRGMLYGVAILFANGTIIQTYLADCGLNPAQIGIHTTAINIANVGVTVLFSGLADRAKGGIKKKVALYAFPAALCYGLLAALVFLRNQPPAVIFGAALIISVLQYSFYGMQSLYDYKIPYNLIDLKYYGVYSSVCGIVTGVVSVGVSALFSLLADRYDYITVAAIGFCAAMGIQALAGVVCLLHKEVVTETPPEKKDEPAGHVNLLKMRIFTDMIGPNLSRGLASGIVGMAAVMALTRGFSSADTSRMVTMASLGVLCGCGMFAVLTRRVLSARGIMLVGAVLLCVGPFMFLGGTVWFLAAYFIVSLAKCLTDYSIPAALYDVVPYEAAGAYHAWRLVLNSAGVALGSMAAGYLLEIMAAEWLFAAAALLQLYCSLSYYFTKSMQPKKPAKN